MNIICCMIIALVSHDIHNPLRTNTCTMIIQDEAGNKYPISCAIKISFT